MRGLGSGSMLAKFAGTSAASVGVVVFTFVSGVFVARMLGPAARGEYGSILLVAQTATSLASMSFYDGVVVRLKAESAATGEAERTAVSSVLAVAAVLTVMAVVLLGALLPVLGLSLREVSNAQFLLLAVGIAGTTYFESAFISIERSQLLFTRFNLSRLLSPALFGLSLMLFWVFGSARFGVATALWLFILSKTPVIFIWAWIYRRELARRLWVAFTRAAAVAGLRLHVAFVLTVLAGGMDRLIGIAAWDNATLGQYFVAFSAVGAGLGVISSSLTAILLPYLAATPKPQRAIRINQVLRLTLLASAAFVVVGFVILPYLIPLLYGDAFAPSVRLALFLLVALSIQPVRAVVLEASRSLGAAMPSTVIALTSIAVLWVGYFVTGYRDPVVLIVFLGLANILSTLVGAWNLHRDADLILDRSLLPGAADFAVLRAMLLRSKEPGK